MDTYKIDNIHRIRREKAKKAVALAMWNRWEEAEAVNRSILREYPTDLEAFNRLGKALSELGRNREAKGAFQQALTISPNNSIARKNLERLSRLGDRTPRGSTSGNTATPHMFIEESGKAEVTSLANLSAAEVLLRLAPGHPVRLEVAGKGLRVTDTSGQLVGQVKPRLASRLIRLTKGGNRYEATVTSVDEQELTVIIWEVYKHPSQAATVSFPSKGGANSRVYLASTLLGYEPLEEEIEDGEPAAVKDWSSDDTEPGDDVFTPVLHRIINTGQEGAAEETEDS